MMLSCSKSSKSIGSLHVFLVTVVFTFAFCGLQNSVLNRNQKINGKVSGHSIVCSRAVWRTGWCQPLPLTTALLKGCDTSAVTLEL